MEEARHIERTTKNDGAAPDAAAGTRPRFKRASTTAIMQTAYPPLRWVVPGYVPEGLTLLAGRQKLGKTWLAIDLAIAVACGGAAMGSVACEQGDVLYIDLENGSRRIQRRIRTRYAGKSRPVLNRLEWAEEAPAFGRGLLDGLDEWRLSVSSPRLVVIDVLQRMWIAGPNSRRDMAAALQEWGGQARHRGGGAAPRQRQRRPP